MPLFMQLFDSNATLLAVGSILGIAMKFILEFIAAKSKGKKEDNDQRFSQIESERKELIAAQTSIRQDLMNQILELRSQVIKFQEANMKYISDNAQLRALVGSLEEDNKQFQNRIVELEREVHDLRSRSHS